MPARHTPLALLAALAVALACSLRPYTGESGTGTSSSSSGETPPPATGTSSTSATTTAPATSTGGPVTGTWRGSYTYGADGVGIFAKVFVDCATQRNFTLVDANIPSYCRGAGPGIYVHVEGILHPDGDDEDLLDDLEVTSVVEGPCRGGTCDEGPVWTGCGTWLDACGCDPFLQNCPDGDKCVPYSSDNDQSWDAHTCIPVMPGAGGTREPCTFDGDFPNGVDTCAKGHVCWAPYHEDWICVPQCTGSPDDPMCPACSGCRISGDGILTLCFPSCSPLRDDCSSREVCIPVPQDPAHLICVLDISGDEGQLFDPCTEANACDNGLWCAPSAHASECDPQASGCCLPFCDLTQPTCPGAGQICVPWYDPDAPPTCDANFGHCRLP